MRFIKHFILGTLLWAGLLSPALAQQESWYLVTFTDKPTELLSTPEKFLSQRALDRRSRSHIEISEEDLPLSSAYLQKVNSLSGLSQGHRLKWMNAVTIKTKDESVLDTLNSWSFVQDVKWISQVPVGRQGYVDKLDEEKDLIRENVSINSFLTDYGDAWPQVGMIGVNSLHKDGYTGKGIWIGVFDNGFSRVDVLPYFESLWTNGQIIGQQDMVDGDQNALHGGTHGTAVMSTMAVTRPGSMIGTAPDASYYLFRTEVSASETLIEEYHWAAAAEFADSVGIDIINSSLGYSRFDDPAQNHTYADMNGDSTVITKAANRAFKKGILVVNSAGNSGNRDWYYITAPADGKYVMAIGAIGIDQQVAPFSSRGPNSAGQTKPDVCALGWNAIVATQDSSHGISSGTSFSSPITAGACASLWQAYPQASNYSVALAVRSSAHQYDSPDTLYGYGIPDFAKALQILKDNSYPVKDNSTLLSSFVMYPNPATNELHLDFISTVSSETIRFKVTDTQGRTVLDEKWTATEGYNHNSWSILHLETGTYVTEFFRGEERSVRKLSVVGR
ncbi:S8 family peptidase [bacterium SCSIO 12741]|nr:S8 family peptidase [bacterium SCSIO 12741]